MLRNQLLIAERHRNAEDGVPVPHEMGLLSLSPQGRCTQESPAVFPTPLLHKYRGGGFMRLGFAAVLVAMLWCSASAGETESLISEADVEAFQGMWVLDLVRSGLPESAAERRVIATDPTSMRVDVYRPRDIRPFTLVYNLDGSPTTNRFGEGSAVSRLRREGPGLLTETVYTVKDHPVTVRELLPPFLGPTLPGVEVAIEVMVRVEHGYQGAPSSLESPPNASKATKIFTKQP